MRLGKDWLDQAKKRIVEQNFWDEHGRKEEERATLDLKLQLQTDQLVNRIEVNVT